MAWNPLGELSQSQREQLDVFSSEFIRVNKRVNLVAAATTPLFEERHLVHSLALAHLRFPDGSTVVDFGTGGGLPAIPLAIRFPNVRFVAVDAVYKKTEAVRLFVRRLGLENVDVWNGRAEDWRGEAHYAVSRATAPLAHLWSWLDRVFARYPDSVPDDCWPQGLVALKGGDLTAEINALLAAYPGPKIIGYDLLNLLGRPYFEHKQILCVSI